MFGSEIKSFLSHPCFEKELDEEKIPEYLSYEYIPYENTIFKNVYKLPGAHCFVYQNGKLEVERYYRIQYRIEEDKPLEMCIRDRFCTNISNPLNTLCRKTAPLSPFAVSYTHLDVYKRQRLYWLLIIPIL